VSVASLLSQALPRPGREAEKSKNSLNTPVILVVVGLQASQIPSTSTILGSGGILAVAPSLPAALDRRASTAQSPRMLARILPWRRPRINVIEMHGLIAPRPGAVSAGTMAPLIDRAFRSARGQPVILDIESPGGSPVQSDLIAALVRRRADEHKVRVHAVIREVGASGGYWLACAADEIHANPMSIVGSIGVRGGGFGFPDMLARFGVERRLYTAGSNKARLDPFSPEKPEDIAFVQELLDALHERFKGWVRLRRGNRLKGDEAALFDGSFMLGERALEVGLIDGFADIDSLVSTLGGARMKSRVFRPRRRGLLGRLPRLAVDALFDAVEERSWRSVLGR
jgi:ClpP class serine protease